MCVVVTACGEPGGAPPADGDASTGQGTSTSGSSTSTSTSTSASTSTSTSTGESDSSASESSSSSGEPEPEVTCTERGCWRSCSYQSELDYGTTGGCECTSGIDAEDRVDCKLPAVCEGKGYFCKVQALRYGIVGAFTNIVTLENWEDYGESTIEILGGGQARELTFTQEHTCCGGSSVDSARIEGFPEAVRPADSPSWDECFATLPEDYGFPECFTQGWFGAGVCEGPLEVCPEATAHVPGCDAECPMANDGVCDEPAGTALCADGCDPIDCACPDDEPGVCNEPYGGGACPFGSDADDCPGLDPF